MNLQGEDRYLHYPEVDKALRSVAEYRLEGQRAYWDNNPQTARWWFDLADQQAEVAEELKKRAEQGIRTYIPLWLKAKLFFGVLRNWARGRRKGEVDVPLRGLLGTLLSEVNNPANYSKVTEQCR